MAALRLDLCGTCTLTELSITLSGVSAYAPPPPTPPHISPPLVKPASSELIIVPQACECVIRRNHARVISVPSLVTLPHFPNQSKDAQFHDKNCLLKHITCIFCHLLCLIAPTLAKPLSTLYCSLSGSFLVLLHDSSLLLIC